MNRLVDHLRQAPLKEVSLICMLIVGFATSAHYFWGELATTYIWLSVLTLWFYFNSKKGRAIRQKFIDIDERDMDFKDEYDQLFVDTKKATEELSNRLSKIEKKEP